jgi:lysophospholipase L1-like esterase
MAIRRRRTWAKRIGTLVAVAAALAIAVELGAFGALRWLAHRELRRPDPRAALAAYRDAEWAPGYWQELTLVQRLPEYYPYVVWRRETRAGETILIDGEGRRRTHHSRCVPGAYTVYMFGGSTLWGYGAPDWATIPSYLAEEYARHGRMACIENFGEFGWVGTQGVLKLVLELKAGRRPDLVIGFDGCNDVLTPLQSGRVDVHGNFREIKAWHDWHRQLALGSFGWLGATNSATLAGRVAMRLGPGGSGWRADTEAAPLARRIVQDYVGGVDIVEALGVRHGFKSAFFWQPVALAERKSLTPEERSRVESVRDERHRPLPALYEQTYELIRAIRRPSVHYLADVFNDERGDVYLDICHLAPPGNRLVARRMYEVLQAHGL